MGNQSYNEDMHVAEKRYLENGLLNKILKGEEITETFETDAGMFVIQYPTPEMLRLIDIEVSRRYPGCDINHILESSVRSTKVYVTLDMVVKKGPDWWENLRTCEACPDQSLILYLYGRFQFLCSQVREKIDGPVRKVGIPLDELFKGSTSQTVDDGAFSNITNG